MVKVVAGKSARAVGCAAFTGTNAAAGAEHLVVDTKAIQASLAVVGGGAASTHTHLASAAIAVAGALGRSGCFAHTSVTNLAVSALRVVHARAASPRPASKAGCAIVGCFTFRF